MEEFNSSNIKPLNISVSRSIINGQMYDVFDYDHFVAEKLDSKPGIYPVGVIEEVGDKSIVLPYKGKYNNQTTPGIYSAGVIDFKVLPDESEMYKYESKIINMSNMDDAKELINSQETIKRLETSHLTTTPDNVTQLPIGEKDKPAMRLLKMGINAKHINLDDYGPRFGSNYPNDKRQLKNDNATLNIINRYCDKCDMELLLTLRDKNPDVPNPIGRSITVSLSENYSEEDE